MNNCVYIPLRTARALYGDVSRRTAAGSTENVKVELDQIAKVAKKPLAEVLPELVAAGLGSVPGGGAEVFSERVRQEHEADTPARRIRGRPCAFSNPIDTDRDPTVRALKLGYFIGFNQG